MPRSRLRGVPTALSAPAVASGRQLSLAMAAADRGRREILAGVVHVRGWLDLEAQRELVRQFRAWAVPPAGLRHPRMPSGHLMSVQSVCLGWHWQPYVYSRTADDTDGASVKALPPAIADLAREAARAAQHRGRGVALERADRAADARQAEVRPGVGVH